MVNPEILSFEYMQPVARKEPIRLFTDDRLERLAHARPASPAIVWFVVSVGALTLAVRQAPGMHILSAFVLGVIVWTLAEYLLHRFVFHLRSDRRGLKILGFMLHGIHHAQPMVESRLVMPLAAGIPIAVVFYALFAGLAGAFLGAPHWVLPLFGGFIFGYEIYSFVHYAVHAYPRLKLLQGIRRHHLLHHGKDHTVRFGVSSPLWDVVFGTMPTTR